MSTAIEKTAVTEPIRALVPSSPRALIMREALREDAEQRQILSEYIKTQMRTDVDFGIIPGTKKPTLLKPGAEKLVDLYRCVARFKIEERIEDWEKGFFVYQFRCRIYSRDTGSLMAEGFGSANSREGKYRWRDAQRKCPTCLSATIFKSKGAGWYCWAKKGGCGAQFRDGDAAIESQEQGRIENDDSHTLANTILKMGKKRSLVDASIALARCSDMFTQDAEDLAPREERTPMPTTRSAPVATPAPRPVAVSAVAPAVVLGKTEAGVTIIDGSMFDASPDEHGDAVEDDLSRTVRDLLKELPATIPGATYDDWVKRCKKLPKAEQKMLGKEGLAHRVRLESTASREADVMPEWTTPLASRTPGEEG